MKKMFIMVGVPGSGKSYLANQYLKKYKPYSIICSADDFFYNEDYIYNFDRTKLGQAHSECQKSAENALINSIPVVIIDNTNTTEKERNVYVNLAKQYGYEYIFCVPETEWVNDSEECYKRNKHGVPLEVIKRMHNNLKSFSV